MIFICYWYIVRLKYVSHNIDDIHMINVTSRMRSITCMAESVDEAKLSRFGIVRDGSFYETQRVKTLRASQHSTKTLLLAKSWAKDRDVQVVDRGANGSPIICNENRRHNLSKLVSTFFNTHHDGVNIMIIRNTEFHVYIRMDLWRVNQCTILDTHHDGVNGCSRGFHVVFDDKSKRTNQLIFLRFRGSGHLRLFDVSCL